MAYVRRDESGRIVALSDTPVSSAAEDGGQWVEIAANDPELLAFLRGILPERATARITTFGAATLNEPREHSCALGVSATDASLIRVLEDLIDLLIERGVIRFTDLPPAAQAKLTARRHWRTDMRRLTLLDDDDNDVI